MSSAENINCPFLNKCVKIFIVQSDKLIVSYRFVNLLCMGKQLCIKVTLFTWISFLIQNLAHNFLITHVCPVLDKFSLYNCPYIHKLDNMYMVHGFLFIWSGVVMSVHELVLDVSPHNLFALDINQTFTFSPSIIN